VQLDEVWLCCSAFVCLSVCLSLCLWNQLRRRRQTCELASSTPFKWLFVISIPVSEASMLKFDADYVNPVPHPDCINSWSKDWEPRGFFFKNCGEGMHRNVTVLWDVLELFLCFVALIVSHRFWFGGMDAIMAMFSRTSSASFKTKGFAETLETLFFGPSKPSHFFLVIFVVRSPKLWRDFVQQLLMSLGTCSFSCEVASSKVLSLSFLRTCFYWLAVIRVAFRRKVSNTILLVGLSDAGKTTLFYQVVVHYR
jgi:hypothetical protein